MRKKEQSNGFTIVELLIVIVVIGILAAITVVAYNSIQGKARNTQLLAAIDTYEKAIRMYMAEHDGEPPKTAVQQQVCLGEDYGVDGIFGQGVCAVDDEYGGFISVDDGVNNALKPYIRTLPQASKSNTIAIGNEGFRGVFYYDNYWPQFQASYPYIFYFIRDKQECGRGIKTQSANEAIGDFTQCFVYIKGEPPL